MAYPYYQPNPYQNFFPATYQPMVQQQPSQPVPQSGINWISGDLEAQMYPVAPNNAVTLWSQTEPVVYMKQADATGKPTLKTYDLIERNGASSLSDRAEKKSDGFARREDLDAVMASVSEIRAEIEAIKGDLYGVAGKRRAKRNDADDE